MPHTRVQRLARSTARRRVLFGTTALAGLIAQAYAQQTPAPAAEGSAQTITVTGFRGSLNSATTAKREAVGLEDSIHAEDMGKFPDANIAESLARIPGVAVTREITGEGLQIQIRGLGTSFTRILLNGAPVASASTGRTDAQSANREVDLDFLPTELFTKLVVSKSPSASMLEGGAAGVVDMRSARPFDKKGTRGSFNLQATKNEQAPDWGHKGSALASTTWGNTLGILGGVAWSQNRVKTTGFETIGWTNANLSATQSTSTTRNATGGGNWTIPATVPSNAGNGLPSGAAINQAFLLARNPGLDITQIDNALLPRLGRGMVSEGTRERLNGVLSVEWRPTADIDTYLDTVVGKKRNRLERADMNWIVRNGSMIPINMKVDRSDCAAGCVVTQGTFANSQFFFEYRPFNEDTEFVGVNPGFEWRLSDKLKVDGQANLTRSRFHRESPSVLLTTAPNSGLTVTYDNSTGLPNISSSVDLNDPTKFGWFTGSRVQVQEEKRDVKTQGARFNLSWGDMGFTLKGGAAYDDVYRRITSLNNDNGWQNAVCGNNLSAFLPAPNNTNPGGCNGAVSPSSQAAAYPGYGTGYTAGATTPIAYLGSLIPNANVKNYLFADPRGFVGMDWARFAADSNYDFYHQNVLRTANGTNTGTNPGFIQEKVSSVYLETSGRTRLFGNLLRYNAGVRHAETEQIFGSVSTLVDPRNAQQSLRNGGLYPNDIQETLTSRKYSNTLPSATLAYNLLPDVLLRTSASRSMTRPNPQDLRTTALQFTDPAASQATLTNADLKPYVSDNVDLGLEWYTGREGYLSAAYFMKDITAFTGAQNNTVKFSELARWGFTYQNLTAIQRTAIDQRGGPDVAEVVVTQQVNSDALLKVRGLELGWVQPLDFLPVKGFGIQANYTRIKQSATNNAGYVAVGVPPYTYNLTAYYEKDGLMVRVSHTFSKGSMSGGSPQNGVISAALFSDDYDQTDLSTRLDLSKLLRWKQQVELTFDVWNLTRSYQRNYFQFPNATWTKYEPGRTYLLGVRTKF